MADPRAVWRAARTVCFDVDSTVSPDEAIDVLADIAGVGAKVAALTRAAMGGTQTFQESLAARLALIQPTPQLIERCLRAHPPRLTPGIASLIAKLHAQGVAVHVVSGGFRPFIEPLADMLHIARDRVHANQFRFAEDGRCLGVDETQPTCRSGGKAEALRRILAATPAPLTPLVMVGDGMTDMETRPPADLAIGFGGIVERPAVKAAADWFVFDPRELETARL